MHNIILLWVVLILLVNTATAEESATAQQARFDYAVHLSGLEGLTSLEESAHQTLFSFQHQKDPPVSRFLLARRVDQDRKRLTDLLKSHGYFAVEVAAELIGETAPLEVRFHVKPGPLHRLAAPEVRITPVEALFAPPEWKTLGLVPGEAAESGRIIQAGEKLVESAREQGFPKARMVHRRVVRDRERQEIQVSYQLETGPRVRLGDVVPRGSGGVDVAFLKRRVPWNRGIRYHPKRLEETRQAFVTTGLFSVVRVRLAERPDERNLWPVEVELTERKPRTWRAGGGFSTDQGVVVNGGWEHRNFWGAGERLQTGINLGMQSQTLSGSITVPDYHQRGQMLKFSGKLDNAIEQAYENVALDLAAGLVRQVFAPGGEGSLTIDYRLSTVRELSTDHESSYSLLSLPLAVTLDRSNDPLNASQGWRFFTELAPHMALTGESVTFLRFSNKASHYYTWPDEPRLVLAGRAELDVTLGAEHETVPADTRLYAGGGASVRGYGQQMAGPLDDAGKPSGGLSVLAWGAEARYRLGESFGVVGFVDAGRAFTSPFPGRELDLLYGVGGGIRYLTVVGPLRLDVAAPLERRPGVDAPWQLYLSIGQAF
ncbi:MAG: BamA/TamA family outer membrane protein [Magnetococcales bacterium]|nr:BamA/TamA family outer membrane protein [Magnetococcales bacterium]